MAQKREKWAELVQGIEADADHFKTLTDRELAIVGAATIDVAVAHLIECRLVDHPKDIQKFLGLEGGTNAPAGSFGARIQLAKLIGIFTPKEITAIDAVRKIRNHLAHRVNASLHDSEIKSAIVPLSEWLRVMLNGSAPEHKTLLDAWFKKLAADKVAYERSILQHSLVGFKSIFENKKNIITRIRMIGDDYKREKLS